LPSELLGAKEAAETLGMTQQNFRLRRLEADFPKPVAELACGPIWTRDQLIEYARQRADHYEERPAIKALAAEPTRYDPYAHAETR
jgi:hypothetical protein